MSTYFVGDVHGCYKNLKTILDDIHFNHDLDTLYLTGDLVARGPSSLEVLRWIRSFPNSMKTVLGNHDLYLLKTYYGTYDLKFRHSFESILNAPDSGALMHWLRQQPILHVDKNKKLLMSHAGIHPNWDIHLAQLYAQEIENILISDFPELLFNNTNQLQQNINININKLKQIQNNLNSFTKIRYVYPNGRLNLTFKDTPEKAPNNIYPWFNLSNHITPNYSIIFGHWASLKSTQIPFGFYGLDSGCCWGGFLTILRWEDKKIIRIPCSPPA